VNLYKLLQDNKERIETIAKGYGVYHIRIFGSVARNEANEKSDIDLLIDLEPGRSLFDLSGFIADMEELLDYPVDAVTENGLKPRMRNQVLREARPL
jgi:uncharacterized protein